MRAPARDFATGENMGMFVRGGVTLLLLAPAVAFANPAFQTPLRGGALYIFADNPDNRVWSCGVTWKVSFDNGSASSTNARDARFRVPPNVKNRLVYRSSAISGKNFQMVDGPTINCN
jgi:hypothetical protein